MWNPSFESRFTKQVHSTESLLRVKPSPGTSPKNVRRREGSPQFKSRVLSNPDDPRDCDRSLFMHGPKNIGARSTLRKIRNPLTRGIPIHQSSTPTGMLQSGRDLIGSRMLESLSH